jgi:hypothetical protein
MAMVKKVSLPKREGLFTPHRRSGLEQGKIVVTRRGSPLPDRLWDERDRGPEACVWVGDDFDEPMDGTERPEDRL